MPSPTPWQIERSTTGSGVVIRVADANGKDIRASAIGSTTAPEGSVNSEMIVRAVNAYDDLTAALRALLALPVAQKELEFLAKGIGTATPNAAWTDALVALAKAEAT